MLCSRMTRRETLSFGIPVALRVYVLVCISLCALRMCVGVYVCAAPVCGLQCAHVYLMHMHVYV